MPDFTPPSGGASITDILGVLKNVATAINGWTSLTQSLAGRSTVKNITTNTLVKTGAGQLCAYSLIALGSADGSIHDAASVATASSANQIDVINHSGTLGYHGYNPSIPVALGIVVKPGTGQNLMVNFS